MLEKVNLQLIENSEPNYDALISKVLFSSTKYGS